MRTDYPEYPIVWCYGSCPLRPQCPPFTLTASNFPKRRCDGSSCRLLNCSVSATYITMHQTMLKSAITYGASMGNKSRKALSIPNNVLSLVSSAPTLHHVARQLSISTKWSSSFSLSSESQRIRCGCYGIYRREAQTTQIAGSVVGLRLLLRTRNRIVQPTTRSVIDVGKLTGTALPS